MSLLDEVNEAYYRFRQNSADGTPPEFFLIDRATFYTMEADIELMNILVRNYMQENIKLGDKIMGVEVCVSERKTKLLKAV
jgi:hypothetical protein